MHGRNHSGSLHDDAGNAGHTVAVQGNGSLDMDGPMQDRLAKYNPGLDARRFDVEGAAKFIAKGSDIVFECHFTPDGRVTSEQPKVAIMLAANPPERRYFTTAYCGANASRTFPGTPF